MASRLLRADAFEEDLDGALDYLSSALARPQSAAKLLDGIRAAESLLADFPLMNPVASLASATGHEYRKHHVGAYVIVYTVTDDAVVFLRLFHQAQDYGSMLARVVPAGLLGDNDESS